jgi:hypothetical protein
MKTDKKEILKKMIRDLTKKAREIVESRVGPKAPDAKDKPIIEALKADFGCARDKVVKLVESITGKKLMQYVIPIPDDTFIKILKIKGVAVVATINDNSHNYPIGEPVVSTGEGQLCILTTGKVGNSMSTMPNKIRLANEREIKKFVDECDIEVIYRELQVDAVLSIASLLKKE